MWALTAGVLIVLALGAWTLARVRTEYRTQKKLSRLTIAAAWVLYSLHFVLTLVAAYASSWILPIPEVLSVVLGAAFMLFGTYLYAAGIIAFGSLSRMSGADTSQLVSRGIYRWSRNPQNVGWTVFLAGVALVGQSGMALLLALLFWLMFLFYVPIEEKFLGDVFGSEYGDYCTHTHRYFGFPKA